MLEYRNDVEKLSLDNVEECFTYARPAADQIPIFEEVRNALVDAARVILRVVPDCPDRSVALRKLREARMDANSAIAHRGKF